MRNILFILLSVVFINLKAQENKQSAFTFNYTYQIPTSDLANTFGDNSAIGASYFSETANNLFYGIEGNYMFIWHKKASQSKVERAIHIGTKMTMDKIAEMVEENPSFLDSF